MNSRRREVYFRINFVKNFLTEFYKQRLNAIISTLNFLRIFLQHLSFNLMFIYLFLSKKKKKKQNFEIQFKIQIILLLIYKISSLMECLTFQRINKNYK
jgi:hypothetical protein